MSRILIKSSPRGILMSKALLSHLNDELEHLKQAGLYKYEHELTGQQQAQVHTKAGKEVINLCANNYLGLANNAELMQTAKQAIEQYGYGMASVRFICGTHDIHTQLESRLSDFLGTENTILFSSCFDANGGVFEPLLTKEDAIISDSLNHASIIDGIRLCKAARYRYQNNNMQDLEAQLKAAQNARFRLIVSDGVFSMDGIIANLKAITDLAEKYDALVMIDDCHATGFMGENGRGTHEYCEVMGKIDIISSTFGKALGGASGGFISGRKQIVDWLRQRARPYLFSNSLIPSIAATTLHVLDMLETDKSLIKKVHDNARYFRKHMQALGFSLAGKDHPIIPVMLGDAKLANEMAARLLEHGIYVIGFSYPVVPMDKARIRVQMSAALDTNMLDNAIAAFAKVGRELKVI